LAGYVVHHGDLWTCVASTQPEPATHVFRHADTALRWLKDTAAADYFESLSDPHDLSRLIQSREDDDQGLDGDRMPQITAKLSTAALCD
jgi:hypothetical protein